MTLHQNIHPNANALELVTVWQRVEDAPAILSGGGGVDQSASAPSASHCPYHPYLLRISVNIGRIRVFENLNLERPKFVITLSAKFCIPFVVVYCFSVYYFRTQNSESEFIKKKLVRPASLYDSFVFVSASWRYLRSWLEDSPCARRLATALDRIASTTACKQDSVNNSPRSMMTRY